MGSVTSTKKKAAGKAKSPGKSAKKAATKKVAKKAVKKAAAAKTPKKASTKKAVRRRRKAIAKPTDRNIDPEAMEFIHAIDAYNIAHDRPFPSWSEVLHILRELGYWKKV